MIHFIERFIQWLSRHYPLRIRSSILFLRRRRSLVLRGLICWVIGLLGLHLDEIGTYDFRLSLRGQQDQSNEVVLIDITQNDLYHQFPQKNSLRELKDDALLSVDARFWNLSIWRQLIRRILAENPRIVGVNFFFDERVSRDLSFNDWALFSDERIIWMGALAQGGLIQVPPFADHQKKNFGYGEFLRDEDGMLRSVLPLNPHYPSFALKLAERSRPNANERYPKEKTVINFRGGGASFVHLNLRQILKDEFDPTLLRDKVIIIGASRDALSGYASPVGPLSRSELIAHITDNLIHDRWIQRLPKLAGSAELFVIMLLSVFMVSFFPQKVAFIFLSILGLLISSFSIWIFDTFYVWTPTFSPLIQIFSTWALFVGYLASKMEQKNWQLEQERQSLAQLEQLKNNFVSLISHDLKTPIAKIQAIVDRLLLTEPSFELNQDLKSLRASSNELHRYIQSILKILRVESKDFHLNLEITDINDLVQRATHQIKPLAYEKHIFISERLEPLFTIEVDPTLIQEVLGNILENAVKYTPRGGHIFIETREVEFFILIRIRDTGEGISPEDIENVFGKFVRGKNQDLRTKGSGLGLYLVKYFIELHGGRVVLSSQLGKGTTVDLYLPTES